MAIRRSARKTARRSKRRAAGRSRRRPGTGGHGNYYRIELRPAGRYVTYRLQSVGQPGHTKRLAGRTAKGTWSTKSWLIRKTDAHVRGGKLTIDAPKAKTVLKSIRGAIRHLKGDIFSAKPRRNVPESEKPTPAQRRAYRKNIKKAQRARRK